MNHRKLSLEIKRMEKAIDGEKDREREPTKVIYNDIKFVATTVS